MAMHAHRHQVKPEEDEDRADQSQEHAWPPTAGFAGFTYGFETIQDLAVCIEDRHAPDIIGDPEIAFRARSPGETFPEVVVFDEIIPANGYQRAYQGATPSDDQLPADAVEMPIGQFHQAATRWGCGEAITRDRLLCIPAHEPVASIGPDIINEHAVCPDREILHVLLRFCIPEIATDAGRVIQKQGQIFFRSFDVPLQQATDPLRGFVEGQIIAEDE